MRKIKIIASLAISFISLFSSVSAYGEITIEDCVKKAEENYPIIRKYDILSSTREIELDDINKGWLPKIGAYLQGTGQNVVPKYPEALSGVLQQMGQEVKGLGKFQYKVGVDLSQTIWDGGASKVSRELVKSQEEVKRASLDVELYQVRERVENLFFAIKLIEEQIAQNEITYNLLHANLEKLRSMLRNGVAMQSDLDMVEAQMLELKQGIDRARISKEGYIRVLEIYTGQSLEAESFAMPTADGDNFGESERPELRLFEKRLLANSLADKMTEVSLMPKVGFFAQAYYGYPGLDYFKSMMSRDLSFNIVAGVKVSWNIDSFYTKKNSYKKTALNAEDILADKELFLFNTRLNETSERESIRGIKKVMEEDSRIVTLRANVRKAAESQLENGIIDATALLTKISDENLASLSAQLHKIQYIQEIYKLKYLLNK